MTIKARKAYLSAIFERYQKATKGEKKVILNEFCINCRYSRKYAIRILKSGALRVVGRRGPKPIYGSETVGHLRTLWDHGTDLLEAVAALPLWLRYYDDPTCTPAIRQQLLGICSSTMDRLLKPFRGTPLRGLSTTRPASNWVKSHIPLELLDGKIRRPGFTEADTVAHCGNSIEGSYIHSITMTDLFSAWTENRAVWTKNCDTVVEQIKNIEESFPFPMRGPAPTLRICRYYGPEF